MGGPEVPPPIPEGGQPAHLGGDVKKVENEAVADASSTGGKERPVDQYLARKAKIEQEFLNVKRIGIYYTALLLPILVSVGWSYRAPERGILPDLWCAFSFYGVILGFAIGWRSLLRGRFARPQMTKRAWGVMLGTPVLTLIAAGLMLALCHRLGWPYQNYTSALQMEGWPIAAIYGWIALLPAFFEEIAFRGLLLAKLEAVMSARHAMWVSAMLFGIVHFSMVSFLVFLVPMALVAAWLVRRTGSLWPAMFIHFVHNAGIVTLELIGS